MFRPPEAFALRRCGAPEAQRERPASVRATAPGIPDPSEIGAARRDNTILALGCCSAHSKARVGDRYRTPRWTSRRTRRRAPAYRRREFGHPRFVATDE